MADSNLRRKSATRARHSGADAVGQAAAAEKNRQQEVRARIIQALSRLGIPYSEWPDFVQVYHTRGHDQSRYRQRISPFRFQPPAFDRLNQSPEEWASIANRGWEQHRERFLQGCKYWVEAGVDEEIQTAKRTRGPRKGSGASAVRRKRGDNTPLHQRFELAAKYLARMPLKEIAGEHANSSTVGRIAREILRKADWATMPRSKKRKRYFTYIRQEFPKWKYHPTQPARIVHDPTEEAALGDGWVNTPAGFKAA
jgi:hypothetical protein